MFMFNQSSSHAQPFRAALLTNLLYMAVLPFIIYHFASPYMSAVASLLLAALPPALRTLFGLLKHGRLNLLGILSLLSIAVKLLSALIFQDPRLVLLSDSLMTGVHGVLLLGSLLVGKPLLQILAYNMLATTPAAQNEQLMRRWQAPRIRTFFILLTALVGTGLLIQLAVSSILVFTLPTEQFLVMRPIVHYGLLGLVLLIAVLFIWLRRNRHTKPDTADTLGKAADEEITAHP
ncbi:MAG: hypothetical protein J2P37_10965 [Ktedonobacteraceae bacterium]|nr:hypothetical protein [Ktedonobacteraceae bacterium]MBO0791647.1 hypothetical protein [Ktedonobacteraceae bacterium]